MTDRVYRKDKKIYFTYTITLPDEPDEFKNDLYEEISRLCTSRQYKNIMSIGYSVILVYNTPDKKDIIKMVADKDTCAKYW